MEQSTKSSLPSYLLLMTILRLNIVIKCHLLHEFWSLDELILCKKCEQGNHVNIRRDKNPGPAECQWSVVPAGDHWAMVPMVPVWRCDVPLVPGIFAGILIGTLCIFTTRLQSDNYLIKFLVKPAIVSNWFLTFYSCIRTVIWIMALKGESWRSR